MSKLHFPVEKIESVIAHGYKFVNMVKTNVSKAIAMVFQDEDNHLIAVCEQKLNKKLAPKYLAKCKYDNNKVITRTEFDKEMARVKSIIQNNSFKIQEEDLGRVC